MILEDVLSIYNVCIHHLQPDLTNNKKIKDRERGVSREGSHMY